jgi:selenocysteine lyase/cysteine desulfurase
MIYLDHAATSFPKPPAVLDAVMAWFRDVGVSASRGDSDLCQRASVIVADARRRLAALCGMPSERIAFTSGATESLNAFLWGLLHPGDRVLTTAAEHSSVARPLRELSEQRGVELEVLPVDAHGYVDPDLAARVLAQGSFRVFALSHASNVTGAVQDAARFCALARAAGCLTLLDASQTAGVLPLDAVPADAIAASAHKSLLGPPGLGFLAVRYGVHLRATKQGGTGSSRALDRQPSEWPTLLEAGTPNTPAIAGLAAALAWIEARGLAALHRHGLAVADALREALAERLGPSLAVQSPPSSRSDRIGVISFNVAGLDPAEAGAILAGAGVHVRSGFHCAPWIHRYTGTEAAGSVRASGGPFVSAEQATSVARVLAP